MKFNTKINLWTAIFGLAAIGTVTTCVRVKADKDIQKARIEADAKVKIAEMENKKKKATNNKNENHE